MNLRLTLFLLLATPIFSYAQQYNPTEAAQPQGKTIVFRFIAEDDTFYIPYQGNGEKLSELIATIDHYKSVITNGQAKINVDGYCSSYSTAKENLHSAGIRANRVKSELIVRNGITEENFVTTVHASSFEGRKSVVVVTLRVPQIQPVPEKPTEQPKPIVEQPKPELKPESRPEPKPDPESEPQPAVEPLHPSPRSGSTVPAWDKYCFAVRTNLLYDAMLMPTLGVEWRIDRNWGVKLDGSFAWWGSEKGNVQKMWVISPEVRKYMGEKKRFYVGVGGNYGEANIYGYSAGNILGNLFTKDTGYQGTFWNAGLTVGYQLPLAKQLSVDFNLGLGYNSFSYDTFTMINEVRVSTGRDLTKNLWGPTQAGVSLVWMLGK